MRDRGLVVVCLGGTTCFVVSYAIAAALYPGGTWFDAHASGHSFTKNFLCDLMQTRALNGVEATIGSPLARWGLLAMLVSLAAFYEQIARFEAPISRVGQVTRWAGRLACALGAAIPLTPSDRYRELHLISVVGSFVPAVVATVAALVLCRRAPVSRWVRAGAAVTLGAGGIDGLLYAFVYASPALGLVPESPEVRRMISLSLPLFQRLATLGVLFWVAAVCAQTLSRRESGAGPQKKTSAPPGDTA